MDSQATAAYGQFAKRGSTVSGSANCKPRLCANCYGRGDCEGPGDDARKGSPSRGKVSRTKTISRLLWADVHLVGFDYRIRMAPRSTQRSEGCRAGVDPVVVAGRRHAFAAGTDLCRTGRNLSCRGRSGEVLVL